MSRIVARSGWACRGATWSAPAGGTERLDIAVVINHHLNRAPSTLVLDRVAGSLGVSRAARAVLAVVENPEEASERVLVMAKSNLGVLEVRRSGSASRAPRSKRRLA